MVRPSPSPHEGSAWAWLRPGLWLSRQFLNFVCRHMRTSALDNDKCSKDLNPSPSRHQTLDRRLLLQEADHPILVHLSHHHLLLPHSPSPSPTRQSQILRERRDPARGIEDHCVGHI